MGELPSRFVPPSADSGAAHPCPCDHRLAQGDDPDGSCTYQLILDSSTDLMWRNDAEGRVLWLSPSVTEQLGWTTEELLGTSLADLVHPEDFALARSGRAAASSGVVSRRNLRVRRADGSWLPISVQAGPFRDPQGRIVGTFGTAHDRSAEVEAEQARNTAAERFELLVELGDRLGTAESVQQVAEEASRMLACHPGVAAATALLAADGSLSVASISRGPGAQGVLEDIAGAVVPAGKVGDHPLHRLIGSGREVLEVPLEAEGRLLGSLAVVRDPGGAPFEPAERSFATEVAHRVARTLQSQQLTRVLRESEEQMRLAMENAPIGMALVSLDGHFLRVNPALCELLGYCDAELVGQTFQEITHPDDLAADLQNVEDLIAGTIPAYRMEKRYLCRDGTLRWCLLAVSLVRDADGEPVHFISQIMDVSESRIQRERLSYEVTHDPLTGLLNRAGLAEEMDRHAGSESTLLFCDLDNFKELNDNMGHAAGDLALRVVAERLSARLRDTDAVARLGGDEFVVLLRHPGSHGSTETLAEELRAAVRRPISLGSGVTWNLTLSIGTSPTDLTEPSAALEAADGAMRRAKREGRDRVVHGPGEGQARGSGGSESVDSGSAGEMPGGSPD